ncbi:MAG: hypothetical protein K0R47_3571 [Brevibacillus sp.]|nr:hypothetical protein [Brevibacillus sp.]
MSNLFLTQQLSRLVDSKMRIWIKDLDENAETESAPMIERNLARWEMTEEGEHMRLYFNPCQFLAVPIGFEGIAFTYKKDEVVLESNDCKGKLLYRIAFAK